MHKKLVFEQGANANVDSQKLAGWTPLHLACEKGMTNVVEELLSCGAEPDIENKDGWNALMV